MVKTVLISSRKNKIKISVQLYSSNAFQHTRNCTCALLALYVPTPSPTPQTVLKPSRHNSFDLSTLYWVGRGEGTWICKKTALLFATELVKRLELKLRSDCPKDFCHDCSLSLLYSMKGVTNVMYMFT